jgi:hypothetical protein
MKKRTSPIWFVSKQELQNIVARATSISEILIHFGLLNKGHNYRTLKKRLDEEGISYHHIRLGLSSNSGRNFTTENKIPLSDILIANSTYTNKHRLKIRLFTAKLIYNQCYICGQLPEWHSKPLTLQLDHINGISNDNRIENLRILCPHCHSQTDSFAGKNKNRQTKI